MSGLFVDAMHCDLPAISHVPKVKVQHDKNRFICPQIGWRILISRQIHTHALLGDHIHVHVYKRMDLNGQDCVCFPSFGEFGISQHSLGHVAETTAEA